MKIRIVMLYDESYAAPGHIAESVARAYAQKWGYDFVCYHALLDQSLNASWNKVIAMALNLGTADWVFWLDADALILRPDLSMESVINTFSWNRPILFSLDKWGICCGIFAVKNCAWSKALLDFWRELGDEGYDTYGKNKWEQSAMKALIERFPRMRQEISFLPEWLINNSDSWFWPTAWMCHFWGTGCSREMLARAFQEIIKNGWAKSQAWHKLPTA